MKLTHYLRISEATDIPMISDMPSRDPNCGNSLYEIRLCYDRDSTGKQCALESLRPGEDHD